MCGDGGRCGDGDAAGGARHLFRLLFTTKEVGEGTDWAATVRHRHPGGRQIDVDTEAAARECTSTPAVDAAPAPGRPADLRATRGKEHILVLGDEPDVRDLAVRMLERPGTASSQGEQRRGLQAARASKRRIDLVAT